MDVMKVLLVEDDSAACRAFMDYAETLEDTKIVAVTGDAEEAFRMVLEFLPHAMILDLELHQGGGSGLDVLRQLRSAEETRKPFVLVTTNNSSPFVYENARKLGADYICYKHQARYSEREALDLLRGFRDEISTMWRTAPEAERDVESPHDREQRLKRRINAELDAVGISPKAKGRVYLVDTILLVIGGKRDGLVRAVAQKNDATDAGVERAMQNAINKAFSTADIDELLTHYKARVTSAKGAPTLLEFVFYYADKIRLELEEL